MGLSATERLKPFAALGVLVVLLSTYWKSDLRIHGSSFGGWLLPEQYQIRMCGIIAQADAKCLSDVLVMVSAINIKCASVVREVGLCQDAQAEADKTGTQRPSCNQQTLTLRDCVEEKAVPTLRARGYSEEDLIGASLVLPAKKSLEGDKKPSIDVEHKNEKEGGS